MIKKSLPSPPAKKKFSWDIEVEKFFLLILQVKNIIYHAIKDAIAVLRDVD